MVQIRQDDPWGWSGAKESKTQNRVLPPLRSDTRDGVEVVVEVSDINDVDEAVRRAIADNT